MTWKDILKEKDKKTTLFDLLMNPKYRTKEPEGPPIDDYEEDSWMILREFIKFLEDREFLKLTKEGIEVKEPFYVKNEKEDEEMWSFLKSGDILMKGISYPFATYFLAIDKYRTIDGTESEWDGRIIDETLSLKDTKQVIYHFITNNPSEKQRFLKVFREGFFGGEL